MAIRLLKIAFVASISLLCLIYAAQNVANLEACYQAFAYVLGQADHLVYPDSVFPAIQSSLITWLALTLIISLEFAAGLLAAKGVWDLWVVRKAPAEDFNGAKIYALLGCGMGIVVWLGFFAVFGGALFQMWQTEAGGASMDDAFQFFTARALVFLIVSSADK